jgi:hypothetical protein
MREIDFDASSFAGIGNQYQKGSELVSTIANTGIPSLFASLTAICSLRTSTIKRAEGRLVRSDNTSQVFLEFCPLPCYLKSFTF